MITESDLMWAFPNAEHVLDPLPADGIPRVIPRHLGGVARCRNAAKNQPDHLSTLTPAAWIVLNEVLCPEPTTACYGGWWVGWADIDLIASGFADRPFRFTLARGTDADWFVWATTGDGALSGGSPEGQFQSPGLWADSKHRWVVVGSPSTITFHVAGPMSVLRSLEKRAELVVEALIAPEDLDG